MTLHQTSLCRTKTEDGLLLDGVLQTPNSLNHEFFAFLVLHGTGSNFYSPGVLEVFANEAVNAGHVALRVNTRGHDLQCSVPSDSRSIRGGASFERVSDCTFDIDAWLNFLAGRGCSRVVLVGHSMGGVKAAYSQAKHPSPVVKAIACISPPRFSHQHWMNHPNADAFRESYSQAKSLIDAGAGEQMMQCRQPLPLLVSAAGFIDKYGPADQYDLARLIPDLRVPLSVLVGEQTVSSSPAFDSWPEFFSGNNPTEHSVQFEVVPGADMNYSNNPAEPFQRVLNWLIELKRA
jgi:pimeloyl-ACP methyl ester carboxylesterase